MSHLKEREEKICLNCNAQIYGRYCHVCGQENLEVKESFWHLLTHFVYDVTHFDGKFFSSVKYLLFRPGFLSHEYIRGKRNSYLNPIRMYVFVSAIFFLFFLSVLKPKETFISDNQTSGQEKTAAALMARLKLARREAENILANKNISASDRQASQGIVTKVDTDIAILEKDSTRKDEVAKDFNNGQLYRRHNYYSLAEYDSVQKIRPDSAKDGWLKMRFEKKKIEVRQRYGDDDNQWLESLLENYFHSFPKVMFISLPLFALILQLLYVRQKRFYYVNHIIYSLHLYCALFIQFFVLLLISRLADVPYLGWINYLAIPVWLALAFYTYRSMRVFYEQRRAKTILKWVLLYLTAIFMMTFLFIVFAFLSFFTF